MSAQLDSMLRGLEDDRVTYRKKACDDLLGFFDDSAAVAALNRAPPSSSSSWARVYRSVVVYVEKEVAKLKKDVEKDGDKALAKVKVAVKAAAGILKKVIRRGNKGRDSTNSRKSLLVKSP